MLAAYSSVFIASLIGSVHCAAMCGGFVSFCASSSKKPSLSILCYHSGRLISYIALGGIAGFIGRSLDQSISLLGIQKFTTLITGIMLILWGLGNFFNIPALKISSFGVPLNNRFFTSAFKWMHSPGHPLIKSASLGLCSGLLPCGWLYTYVALAATTGNAFNGSVIMAFFWLGTVPILSFIGSASSLITRLIGPRMPSLLGTLLIIAGFFSLYSHYNHSHKEHGHSHHQHKTESHSHHKHH